MSRIALLTDSGADIPSHLLKRYHITLLPLLVHFGDEDAPDNFADRDIFWRRVAAGGVPRTAAPAPAVFAQAFEQALADADEALIVTLTSRHSSTWQNVTLAAKNFDGRIHVFDSWALSVGQSLIVLQAADLIAQGWDAPAILDRLQDARSRLHFYIYLNSLDAIQHGGRIALAMNAVKRMSSILSIRIILGMKEGELKLTGAVRSPQKGIQFIVRAIEGKQAEAVAIAHTRAPDLADRLAALTASALHFPQNDILFTEAGAVLGTHGGPRAFGVALIESAARR
ncbi:MAG: hypothetical protein DSY55_03675 [Clostridia bacterium]|nr:MAG: hypothetical protein DSY55_03675 [Clostridia bacterium]